MSFDDFAALFLLLAGTFVGVFLAIGLGLAIKHMVF